MKALLTWMVAGVLLGTAPLAFADSRAGIEARLASKLDIDARDVASTPIPGLYRITVGPQVAYVSADGRYLIRGDMIDMRGGHNLTVAQRAHARLVYLRRLDPADMIMFPAPHPKLTITVLTDVDCEYCRLLAHDQPTLGAMGISVNYLLFPRAGAGSPAWQQAVSVWCAKDRNAAFEAAMRGEPVNSAPCAATAVAADYRFGQLLGLSGTPAILTDQGRLIEGYLPPAELAYVLGLASAPRR